MHIVLDLDACVGHAQCEDAAPEVFTVNDDGVVELLQENPGEELRSKVADAVFRCPTDVIRVEG